MPICAEDNQPIPADFLRPACHKRDHRASTATNWCSFCIQIAEHIVWAIWRTKEDGYRILIIDERTSRDWPILLSTTIWREVRQRTAG